MEYILIFFLLFIILISIILGNSAMFQESFSGVIDCPDKWENGIRDASNHFCIVPKVKYDLDPTSISGCCLWLDANDYTPKMDGNPSVWMDKSQNKQSFQTSSTNAPETKTLTNGQKYISFNSSKQHAFSIYKPKGINISKKSFSLFVVCRFNNNNNGTVISKWKNNSSGSIKPSGLFVGNEGGNLYTSLFDTEGLGKQPVPSISNKWMILSLMGNLESNGKFYINGIQQKDEFNPSSKNNIFSNDYSIVVGGTADNTGYTMHDISNCIYKDVSYTVEEQVVAYGKVNVITENAIVTEQDDYIVYTFENNGKFMLEAEDKKTVFDVKTDTLAVGGGGGGGYCNGAWEGSGGGGAGMVCIHTNFFYKIGKEYTITVGEGGGSGQNGSPTVMKESNGQNRILSLGGGRGGNGDGGSTSDGISPDGVGSGGGGQGWARSHPGGNTNGMCNVNSGGAGGWVAGGGGGGGAGSKGETTNRGYSNGGKGGRGFTWWVTGDTYGSGGHGGESRNSGGKKPESNGGNIREDGLPGKNPGDGGGGGGAFKSIGGNGKKGIFRIAIDKWYLRYAYIKTIVGTKTKRELDCSLPPLTIPTPLNPNMYLDGDIAEIIAYSNDSDMADEKRNRIETYLAVKWDLIRMSDFSNNSLISSEMNSINIGKKESGYIGYDTNTNAFVNANGSALPVVWNNEGPNKSYQIDFSSPAWETNGISGLQNACVWAKTNNIYWDKISADCRKENIDLLSH